MVKLVDFIGRLPTKAHVKIVQEWEEVLEDPTEMTPALDVIVKSFRKRNPFADSHTQTLQERIVFQCYRQIALSHLGLTSH